MTRLILFLASLICTVFCFSTARSQYYFYDDDYYDSPVTLELGFSAGGMNCLTDLGGKKGHRRKFIQDANWSVTQLYGSLYAAADYQGVTALRLEFSLGQIAASDNLLKNAGSASYGRFMRNLSFRSAISEASLLFELHPLAITNNNIIANMSPYILAGLGFFRFSPQAYYNNSWVMLPDLHTEGQGFYEFKDRKPYKLSQPNMPLGCGIKYEISAVLNFRFEIVYRKLWTDYLDDVSKTYVNQSVFDYYLSPTQAALARKLADRHITSDPAYTTGEGAIRGNDKNNDSYFSFSLKTALIFGRTRRN